MAFANILDAGFTEFFASETTTHNITLPSPIDPGDLIVLKVFVTGTPTITASGFTEIGTEINGDRYAVLAKVAVGDEDGATVNVETSANAFAIVHDYLIEAGTWFGDLAGLEIAFATGTSATPDPPSLTPSWGALDTLWLPGCGKSSGTITGAPTDYTNLINGSGGDNMGSARRNLNSASENPGTFAGSTSATWVAGNLAIQPAPSVDLYPTADGTDTDVVDEGDATTDLYASIDDDPASPSDTDWNNNTDDAGQAFYELTNMPSDFDEAISALITVRYRGQEFDGTGTVTLYARLYQSDESTPLSDEVQVAQVTADSSFTNTSPVTLTGIVASTKTIWDGARLRLRWART